MSSLIEISGVGQALYRAAREVKFGPARPGAVRFSRVVVQDAEEALGYRPLIAFEKVSSRTVEWCKQQTVDRI